MSARRWMAAWLVVAAAATAGCDGPEYGALQLRKLAGDLQAEVEPGEVFVPRGGVLMFGASPVAQDGGRDYKGWERLELRSTQPGVAEVRPAIVRDAWVVNGQQAGSTSLEVTIDGHWVDSIDVTVEEVAP